MSWLPAQSPFTSSTTTTIALPIYSTYPLVLLTASTSLLLNPLHTIPIGVSYRPRAAISYPQLYATLDQEASNPAAFTYNCAQRAHANYVENITSFVGSLLIAGLVYPRTAVGLGVGWIACRVMYLWTYVRVKRGSVVHGKPPGGIGTAFWAFQYALYGLSFKAGWDLWGLGAS